MSSKLIDVVIIRRTVEGAGVVILELAAVDGSNLPPFNAGAHIDVHIDDGLVRQYSLCNNPNATGNYRIGVLNDPNSRGGSVRVFNEFSEQQKLKISEPRNHFPLAPNADKSILAGGGIGITPMIAMAYELSAAEQPFELHYCTRTKGAGAFELELLETFGSRVVFHYDDQDKSQLFDPAAVLNAAGDSAHLYVCGPTGFMDWVINQAEQAGLPSKQVHFEYFSAEVDTDGDAFEVYCDQSEITITVESDDTIAKALRKAGIRVDMSCEEGVCGTCITDVLEGEPDHRDHFLTDEEKEDNDQIALCCSRAKGKRLVIDL